MSNFLCTQLDREASRRVLQEHRIFFGRQQGLSTAGPYIQAHLPGVAEQDDEFTAHGALGSGDFPRHLGVAEDVGKRHNLGVDADTCVHSLQDGLRIVSWNTRGLLGSVFTAQRRHEKKTKKTTHKTTRHKRTPHQAHGTQPYIAHSRRLPVRHLQLFLRSLRSSIGQFSSEGWTSSWSSS